jgi:uncharacterized protein with HEPN domain
MKQRLSSDYLADICKAAEKAVSFLGGMSREAFAADEKTAFAVIRALEIVGEATKRITQEIRDRYPKVPWRSMAAIRDKLVHDYLTVNLEIVWKTVTEDIPPLLPSLRRVLDEVRQFESSPPPGSERT